MKPIELPNLSELPALAEALRESEQQKLTKFHKSMMNPLPGDSALPPGCSERDVSEVAGQGEGAEPCEACGRLTFDGECAYCQAEEEKWGRDNER